MRWHVSVVTTSLWSSIPMEDRKATRECRLRGSRRAGACVWKGLAGHLWASSKWQKTCNLIAAMDALRGKMVHRTRADWSFANRHQRYLRYLPTRWLAEYLEQGLCGRFHLQTVWLAGPTSRWGHQRLIRRDGSSLCSFLGPRILVNNRPWVL